jgi:small subunit ribosomal protein S6e
LFSTGASTYKPRRTGERKRRSVRGCIFGSDLAVVFLQVVKKGEAEIDKVTNVDHPNRRGPKRASNIRKMYALVKGKDDVRKYVIKRVVKKGDKTFYKSPSIQRLVTEKRLRRKVVAKRDKLNRYKASKANVEKYEKLLSQYAKEKKAARVAAAKEAEPAPVQPAKPVAKAAPAQPAKPTTNKPTTKK